MANSVERGHTALEALAAAMLEGEKGQATAVRQLRPIFSHFGRMQPVAAHWLIKGVIPDNELLLLFGDPGGGKSFLALDWAIHVALGLPWLGRKVCQGAVFYIAGEGHHGLVRRRLAWEKQHNQSLSEAPFYLSNRAIPLLDAAAVKELIAEIRVLIKESGKPALIVIDTLARSFAGGDENQAADMAKFIAALDEMRAEFECGVLVVHHTGHADKSRIRGSSALQGAIDTGYRLAKAGNLGLKLECVKAKDFDIPEPIALQLATIELPELVDEDGKEESSAVIVPLTGAALEGVLESEPGKQGKGARQQQALAILRAMAVSSDSPVPLEAWKLRMKDEGIDRKRMSDVIKSLEAAGLIIVDDASKTVSETDFDNFLSTRREDSE